MRTKELPAIEYPADYSNDNHTYFQTEEMANNTNKQVRTVNFMRSTCEICCTISLYFSPSGKPQWWENRYI